jgi:hypothetical protein
MAPAFEKPALEGESNEEWVERVFDVTETIQEE